MPLLLLFLFIVLSALLVGEADSFPAVEGGDPEYQMIDIAEARDDSMEDASDDEGEDISDDDAGDDDSGEDNGGGDEGD
jgi:hypothetical protein